MPSSFRFGVLACLLLGGGRAWCAEVVLNGHTFTLPEGFTIEVAAETPVVDRPITASLDELGRLYVADSAGVNDNVQKQLEDRPHRILRLEDSDGDGRYDRSVVFADRMMFPEGTLWYDGSLYVAAPPSIWKLTDTDGDGAADERVEWFQGKTLTGCANDLHGPYLGPDGWIYWCKGAFAEQTYQRPGSEPFVTRASHIFRCRPDGSRLEPVMTGGMDNPVDVAFTPDGERIFTTTFLVHPGGGLRDGLIHALYGGVYGKDHGVLAGHKRTGELLPALVHLGPAAPCGLARYEAEDFGPEYRDNLFACSFNLHKLTRHVPTRVGAGLAAGSEDFLVSSNIDFHPTDAIEDADGSLLVCDTGGWYKLCCPTSQLWKPDVLGAIYRIRRTDAPPADDPRGLALAWDAPATDELVSRLAHPRPAVRERAMQALAKRGVEAIAPLVALSTNVEAPPAVRQQAVWALTRIDDAAARAAAREALFDEDEQVRQSALHAASLWRDAAARPWLTVLLEKGTPTNRRLAAECLGRIGDTADAPALLAAAATDGEIDRSLEHAIIYALIEIGARHSTRAGLAAGNPAARRAALIALDQMEGGGLKAGECVELLSSPELPVRQAAEWIAAGHPEWGDALVHYLAGRLLEPPLEDTEAETVRSAALEEQLVRFAATASVQEMLAGALAAPEVSPDARRTALRAMARARLAAPPEAWIAALAAVLDGGDSELLDAAVVTVRALPPTEQPAAEQPLAPLTEALLRVSRSEALPPETRLAALAALPGRVAEVDGPLFALIVEHLPADRPVEVRTAAAEGIAKCLLGGQQLLALTTAFETVGPLDADRVLSAFEQTTDAEIGRALAAALGASPALSALRPDAVKARLEKFGPELQPQLAELLALLHVDTAQQQARLEELLAHLGEGDVRRGHAVFYSAKASCTACHALGYVGGRIGPDLTRVGQIRTERDLLEAIVFPSASFVRSYESLVVLTSDGLVHNGLIREETPEAIVLTTGLNKEVRVRREEIDEVQPSSVSVMPSGLEQQLSPRDLADLIAFLRAAK